MTNEQYQLVKQIVQAAWERDTEARIAFVEHACGHDAELRQLVVEILSADEKAGSFLIDPVLDLAETGLNDVGDAVTAGMRLGHYTIHSLIGQGGMGAVYRAVREDDFRMQVAIKLLRDGMAGAALGRFRTERQILAGLQHPNIARLLDGGATGSGLPYLVMEYVDGAPLLDYAAKLTVNQRVELFRPVCRAVHYAHQHSIVHRDIKPANILVTREGIPKLLDFGIAKLLDTEEDAAGLTATGMRMMTPGYASPEQLSGQPVSSATDIYSLGAVLFELLTGRRANVVEISKTTSSLANDIDSDLDRILLKALCREPAARYASAEEFSGDLDRFLQHLPVQARERSVLYRSRKFVTRNRGVITAATAGALFVLTLVAGLRWWERSPGVRTGVSRSPILARWNDLRIEKIAALGDPAPRGGTFTKDFEPWSLNRRGDVAFVAETSAAGNEGVFLVSEERGLSAVPFARVGLPAQGGGTLHGGVLGYTSLNDSGDLAFVFGLKPFTPPSLKGFANAGLYRYSYADQSLSAVVVPGLTPAPGFGVFQSTSQHASINNSGQIAFSGVVRTAFGLTSTQGLGTGIFVADRSGQITKAVAPGDPAPGGSRFEFAQNPWINDRGDVAFGAHVAGEECFAIQTVGPACGESVYFKSAASGGVESVAHQGEQSVRGGLYRWAWGPVLNARGDLVYMGELHPSPGLAQPRGIYLHSGSTTIPIALPGDTMPDGRRIITVNPGAMTGNYSLNNLGEVGFNASLENDESGLYVYSRGALHLVAGTNTVVPGVATISSVVNLMVGGGIVNDRGQVLFGATLTDGRGVLLLAMSATPHLPGTGASTHSGKRLVDRGE